MLLVGGQGLVSIFKWSQPPYGSRRHYSICQEPSKADVQCGLDCIGIRTGLKKSKGDIGSSVILARSIVYWGIGRTLAKRSGFKKYLRSRT